MKSHDEMLEEWKRDPDFQKAYDDLEAEFLLFDELLKVGTKLATAQSQSPSKQADRWPAPRRPE